MYSQIMENFYLTKQDRLIYILILKWADILNSKFLFHLLFCSNLYSELTEIKMILVSRQNF